MGVFATIRRQANRKGVDASVQRIVVLAADILRVLILPVQPNEVEHVFVLDRAYRLHVRARLPNESPVRISQF